MGALMVCLYLVKPCMGFASMVFKEKKICIHGCMLGLVLFISYRISCVLSLSLILTLS